MPHSRAGYWELQRTLRKSGKKTLNIQGFLPGVKITLLSPASDKLAKLGEHISEELAEHGYHGAFNEHELFDRFFESLLVREKNRRKRKKVEDAVCDLDDFEALAGSLSTFQWCGGAK